MNDDGSTRVSGGGCRSDGGPGCGSRAARPRRRSAYAVARTACAGRCASRASASHLKPRRHAGWRVAPHGQHRPGSGVARRVSVPARLHGIHAGSRGVPPSSRRHRDPAWSVRCADRQDATAGGLGLLACDQPVRAAPRSGTCRAARAVDRSGGTREHHVQRPSARDGGDVPHVVRRHQVRHRRIPDLPVRPHLLRQGTGDLRIRPRHAAATDRGAVRGVP